MIACRGRVQREGEVIHVVTETLTDLTDLLRSVGQHDEPFATRHGRGDQATHGGGPDARETGGTRVRDIFIPDLRLGSGIPGGIKVPTRDFR